MAQSNRPLKFEHYDSSAAMTSPRSNAYTNNFQQIMMDADIKIPDNNADDEVPSNLATIKARLKRRRPSLQDDAFNRGKFQNFNSVHNNCKTEKEVIDNVLPLIAGTLMNKNNFNQGFDAIGPVRPELKNVVKLQPNYYDGESPASIDETVYKLLSTKIVPHTRKFEDVPADNVPNFFNEIKGAEAKGSIARLQAMHDGVIGVNAIEALRDYVTDGPKKDDQAQTMTATYEPADQQLIIYAHWRVLTPGSKYLYGYRMCRVARLHLDEYEDFVKGLTFFRNGRELAKEFREARINEANEKAERMRQT